MLHRPANYVSRGEALMIHESQRALDDGRHKNAVDKLRLSCLANGTSGIFSLGRAMRRMDHDGSKMISVSKFREVLADAGMHCSEDEVHELFDAFENDHKGSIDMTKFLEALRSEMHHCRNRVVGECFRKLDKNGEGIITVDDLKHNYSAAHHPLYLNGEETAETILKKFLATFDENGDVDANVSEEDFYNYYSGLSASIEDDGYFDLLLRMSYKL